MRKNVSVGVFALAAVAAGIWCASWYAQAQNVQRSVEGWINYLNAGQTYLTYDALEISGFPTQVKATLTNPAFSGRIDQLLVRLDKDKTLFPQPLPAWQEEMKMDGILSLTVNAFSDKYKMEMTGKWLQHSGMNNQPVAAFVSREPFSSACELEMKRGTFLTNMWSFKVVESPEKFFDEFRSIDCAASDSVLVDEASGKTIVSSGPTRVYVAKESAGDQERVQFNLKYENVEMTKEWENLLMAYVQAFSPGYYYPSMYAAYGKQNGEIDFSYQGPSFAKGNTDIPAFEVNLAKFNLSNALYSGSGHLLAKSEAVAGDNIRAAFNSRFEFSYTPQYDALLEELARSYIDFTAKNDSAGNSELRNILLTRTPEQTFAMVKPAIPKLSPLGTWLQSTDLSYEGKKDTMLGNLKLADFVLSTTPYGITGNGTAQRNEGSLFPEANFTFKCTSCTLLMDDLTGYINHVLQVAHSFYPEEPQYDYQISPNVIQGLKQFLSEISTAGAEENTKGNYLFAITSNPTGNMVIGGHNLAEIMTLYQQHVASKAAPPGGEAPKGDIPTQGWKVE